ncbi:MAG: hypothetical protein GF329_05230 [Candidatus Lokiarchaeota archaeon]|nr:hypothetical protein [Candidatus Lokiarchaeota archaeon]
MLDLFNFLDLIESEIAREFDYDYIIFDAIFLGIFLILLIQQKKFKPLAIGGITAILTYIIDAGFWYNIPSSIPGKNIREYIISYEGVPFTGIQFNVLKFGCDFMMTISYSLVAFSWVWIMFESWNKKRYKDMIFWTSLLFGGWMIIPWLSILFNLNQINVWTIRHMDTQVLIQIIVVLVAYIIMIILYIKKDPKVILYIFFIGCFQAFAMEFPLLISGIRPTGFELLIYETLILTNQGVPYLYIIYREIIPRLNKKLDFKNNNNKIG